MEQRVTIHFHRRDDGGQDIGIQYQAETSEATYREAMLAKESGLHALVLQTIHDRQQEGYSVPPAMRLLAEAFTFRELM